jgi:queuine tRNA-ribosyltransferase
MRFELLAVHAGLRIGVLHTPHGPIPTPAFMPVGTLGTIKALTPDDVRATGAHCVLANTYHLLLRPGIETVRRLGGLHRLMGWPGSILTDSGGFQLFSLASIRAVSDQGVQFQSHLDGTPLMLSPERAIQAQEALGADLIMPLDECVGVNASRSATERALSRTQTWWRRSLAARRRPDDQALFALIQGGLHLDLRQQAARAAVAEQPPGFAIGGLSVGEPRSLTRALLSTTLAELPAERPRYLMGVGSPTELTEYAQLGVDLFDCVLPTRLARTGTIWTDAAGGRLDLARRAALRVRGPLAAGCTCLACTHWEVGALAALMQNREPLAYRLASVHNLTVLARVLDMLRTEALNVLYTGRKTRMLGNVGRL